MRGLFPTPPRCPNPSGSPQEHTHGNLNKHVLPPRHSYPFVLSPKPYQIISQFVCYNMILNIFLLSFIIKFSKNYAFERKNDDEREEKPQKDITNLLLYSSKGHESWTCARLKPGARNATLVPTCWQGQSNLPPPLLLSRNLAWKYSSLQLRSKCNTRNMEAASPAAPHTNPRIHT